jgi:hypothetical protein
MFRLSTLFVLAIALLPAQSLYTSTGYTTFGEWRADVRLEPAWWSPGQTLEVTARLSVGQAHLDALAAANYKADSFICLLTAERSFDPEGKLRFAAHERMSTLVTPTGLGIEGGVTGAVTNRFGYYTFKTPVDVFLKVPLAQAPLANGDRVATFQFREKLPADLPPGVYRVRLDYGFGVATRNYSLDAYTFAYRPFFQGRPVESHHYSPPIFANGNTVDGRWLDAAEIKPRLPWSLLWNYSSNGYRGVVAEEDRSWFALSNRNLIQDDVVIPLFDVNGRAIAYNLEPSLAVDTLEARNNIPWAPSGQLQVEVIDPNGKIKVLGPFPFVAMSGLWPTTRRSEITAWRPAVYGKHKVRLSGWYEDIWGNRYQGGGTYFFWVAKRMTLATATFQGMSYPVGNRYGRDLGFAPAFPADVEVEASLFVNSDPNNVRTVSYSGKATPAGVFGAAQGLKPLPFDAPGEYAARITATYYDQFGHLWVCPMRHAGVVYPADSPIVARGKKIVIGGKALDRGETKTEGYVNEKGENVLVHLNFPYQQSDVLLIASEGFGTNKIEPVLNWEPKDKPPAWDTRLNGVGASNLRIKTSNGLSPHLFPEFITDLQYYYAGAPRPGFMSRFLVGEDNVRAPYWPTSQTNFGGQINTTSNGDMPGDIYRLIGGVVVRDKGKTPLYAGYLASAFILPPGTRNNRVIAPGDEDVLGPFGQKSRFFLVSIRPGMTYLTGQVFTAVAQIDPVLPVRVTFNMTYPDGRAVTTSGLGDAFGSFAAPDRFTLDVPGVYRYTIEGEWQGHKGGMPGLPPQGGEIYVVEANRPAAAPSMKLSVPEESTFDPDLGFKLSGQSSAREVYYAAVIPGAVLAQGYLPVKDGKFDYFLDPKGFNLATPTYDIRNRVSGQTQLGDVIHLTLLSKETGPDGKSWHSFARLIIRGNKVYCVK